MNIRYVLFAIILTFLCGSLYCQTTWNWYNPTPQGNDLHGITIKADSFGIAAGDAGITLRRYKSLYQNPVYPVQSNLSGICNFIDTVWVVGDGGVIYRSINNGASWANQSYSGISKVNFHTCFDISKTNLFVAGDSGIILYSTNSGAGWTKQSNSNKKNINAIGNGGAPNMYAVGDSGTILEAVNYGSFGYYPISTPHKFSFHGVAMDMSEAYIVGDSGYILHRDVAADVLLSDTIMNNGANTFYDVGFANPYVIVIGANGAIRLSTNDGVTWSSPSSGATEKLYKIGMSTDFATSGVAWVVGENGVFLRTSNYGSTWSRLDSGVRGTVYAAAIAPNGDMYATSIVGKSYRLKHGTSQWKLDSLKAGGAPRLTDIAFDQNGSGLIATYDVNILRTGDTGKTWSSVIVNSNAVEILGVAIYGSIGLASSSKGIVYQSVNRGGSWTAATTNNTQPLYDVDLSGNNAIAVGSNGTVIYSGDGGTTWKKPQSSATTAQLNKVRFFTSTNAIAVSNSGIIIRTTNAGSSWSTVTSGVSTALNDVAFHDDKNGIITGDGGIILKTNDGGKTWSEDESNTLFDLKGAMIVNGTTAYVAGSKTTILGTSNSSLPVDLLSFSGIRLSPTSVLLDWKVAGEQNNFGYAIERNYGDQWQEIGFRNGMGTTALAQSYSFVDGIASDNILNYRLKQYDLDGSDHILGTISLTSNSSHDAEGILLYPNPIQSKAIINFIISLPSVIRLTIVNQLGEEIAVVVDGFYQSGSYQMQYDFKQLPSGTYRLLLNTASNLYSKQFVIVH